MRLSLVIVLLPSLLRAEVFTLVQYGDVHCDFSARQQYATNVVPWILAHTNDGVFNIRGIILAGDNFESTQNPLPTNENGNGLYHWFQLTNDLNTLATNKLLVFVAPGNHDCDNTNAPTDDYCLGVATNQWNTIFPAGLFTNQAYYVTSMVAGDNKMMVMKYTNGNIKLLIVSGTPIPGTNATDYITRYAASTAWMSNQAASYPDHNVIFVDHYMLNTNGLPSTNIGTTSGYQMSFPGDARIVLGLLNPPNPFLFVTGHNRPYMKGCYRTNGADGHPIYVTTFNTQSQGNARNCDYMNLFTFDTAKSTMRNRTWIISTSKFCNDYDVANDRFGSSIAQPQGFEHNPPELALPIKPTTLIFRR